MKKYDLLRSGDNILRILEVRQDKALVIDCIKRTMPVWGKLSILESYTKCSDGALMDVTGCVIPDIDSMEASQRKIMYERYTLIAPILPFIADEKIRSELIHSIAAEHGVSK